MATKGVKIFKFTNSKGGIRRVKFYDSGIYTITDLNGEHECGTWEKKPMLVGRYSDKPSKDPNRVYYIGVSFTPYFNDKKLYQPLEYTMRELADRLLRWEIKHDVIQP